MCCSHHSREVVTHRSNWDFSLLWEKIIIFEESAAIFGGQVFENLTLGAHFVAGRLLFIKLFYVKM